MHNAGWLEIAQSRCAKFGLDLSQQTGRNLFDFSHDDQCQILEYARDTLVAAGAPRPVAFRAGNYGANDQTLQALSGLGIRYDSSHCPGISSGASRISLTPEDRIPIGSIDTPPVAGSKKQPAPILPPSLVRTAQRYVEQLVSNTVYGA